MVTWLWLCRAGFEGDCAAELSGRDPMGFARARTHDGWLTWQSPTSGSHLKGLIFPRTGFRVLASFEALPEQDRIGALLPLVASAGPFSAVRMEYPDTNEGRGLQRFLRRFRGPLEGALRQRELLLPSAGHPRLHLFFTDSANGFAGTSAGDEAGPWENGVPRLRLPAAAPSRSALKIEEGWLRLMTAAERDAWLSGNRDAVDLGAAPGGWTWQLARRGLRVTAVDHGRLAPALLDEYPVRHVSADAFTWRPPRPVDWLVCDIVDKPARTLSLMEKWLREGWARAALFNLKLPMKQRFATVDELLGRLQGSLPGYAIRAAQLYHDREEVTVVALPGERT